VLFVSHRCDFCSAPWSIRWTALADFMDQQNAETLAAYRKGDFARAATPALNVAEVLR
jgi:hypothetical protein